MSQYSSSLTVADLRQDSSIIGLVEPGNAATTKLIPRLNAAMPRLSDLGLFKGVLAEAQYSAGSRGYISLDRRHASIVGLNLNNVPSPVYGTFHQYQELGAGYQDASKMTMGGIVDDGDHPIQFVIPAAGKLRFQITNSADVGKSVRIFGISSDDVSNPWGNTIYDPTDAAEGEKITTANPTVDTVNSFYDVTIIDMDDMVGVTKLFVINSDGSTTQIGQYEPGDTRPMFRRYKTGNLTDIRVYCSRRFIRLQADSDHLFPDCLEAITHMLRCLNQEDAEQYEKAAVSEMKARKALDQEVRKMRGSSKVTFSFNTGPMTTKRNAF